MDTQRSITRHVRRFHSRRSHSRHSRHSSTSFFFVWVPAVFALTLGAAGAALAANSVVPGQVETESTSISIGIKWMVQGDDNLNCTVAVQYRVTGASTWLVAQPLFRVEPGDHGNGVDPGNLLAGSVFNLRPNTSYEVKLGLADPDGGTGSRTVAVHTRATPHDPAHPRHRYVVPGNGGGSGTQSNPFRGLTAADAAAQPGDIFHVRPGVYSSVVLTASGNAADPIIWRGDNVGSCILDGGLSSNAVVDLPGTSHVHLENLTIRRTDHIGIYARGTSGVVIRRCKLDIVDTGREMGGIYFLENGTRDAYVADNEVKGPYSWEDGRSSDGFGMLFVGTGHEIRNNRVHDWWDGINLGTDDASIVTSACDVYRNEIYNCTDDGMETDGSRQNIRVFENRFTNVLCGVSCQPTYGGPIYIIHNVIYNWQLKPLKWHLIPSGMVVFNNTFVGADPRGWGGGEWRNAILRNNLFIGGSYPGQPGEPIAISTTGTLANMDYNGWYQARPTRFANFNGSFYATLAAFQNATQLERHARLVDVSIFVDAEEPPQGSYMGETGYFPPYDPGSQDVRLIPGCAAIDAGILLANVTNGYSGGGVDLGAYELGSAIPIYGPTSSTPAAIMAMNGPQALYSLSPGSPNPFRGSTTIHYAISEPVGVTLKIYSATGRLVRTLRNGESLGAGKHASVWDGRDDRGRDAQAGVYFCRMTAGDQRRQQRIVRLD